MTFRRWWIQGRLSVPFTPLCFWESSQKLVFRCPPQNVDTKQLFVSFVGVAVAKKNIYYHKESRSSCFSTNFIIFSHKEVCGWYLINVSYKMRALLEHGPTLKSNRSDKDKSKTLSKVTKVTHLKSVFGSRDFAATMCNVIAYVGFLW